MRKLGLVLFAFASLVVHVTAAALFVSTVEPVLEEAGAGSAAIEIGNLFDSVAREAVKPDPIVAKALPVRQAHPVTASQAISVKSFNQQDVQPTELKAHSPRQIRSASIEKLTANEDLIEPDLVLPTEAKEAQTKPVTKPVKALPVAKRKPTKLKPTTPVEAVRYSQSVKKPNKNKKPTQRASKASRKGGKKTEQQGKKGAIGGKKGKTTKANGSARVSNYMGKLSKRLRRRAVYPSAAKRRHETGTATVRFRIKKNGTISGLKLIKSSGYARLDRAALATVRKSSPFESLPSFVKTRDISMTVPFKFGSR